MDERTTTRLKAPLRLALGAVAQALNEYAERGMLIGGVAVIARGLPRVTRDIDVAIPANGEPAGMLAALARHDILSRIEDPAAFARTRHALLLRHAPSGIDVDVMLASLPFELEAIAAAELVTLAGVDVRVPRPEDLVIYKFVGWRREDQADVRRLLTLYRSQIDLERVRRVVGEIAGALTVPARLLELEGMISRIRG